MFHGSISFETTNRSTPSHTRYQYPDSIRRKLQLLLRRASERLSLWTRTERTGRMGFKILFAATPLKSGSVLPFRRFMPS